MTLLIVISTPESVWMCTDRQLTFADGRENHETFKCVSVECTDGRFLVGYAGLGRTANGMDISNWIANVLRGLGGSFQAKSGTLARAAGEQVPHHLDDSRLRSHIFVIAGFENGLAKVQTISLSHGSVSTPMYLNHRSGRPGHESPPCRVMAYGAGAAKLMGKFGKREWARSLARITKKFNARRISAEVVSGQLAKINYETSKLPKAQTSRRCIVARVQRYETGVSRALFDGLKTDRKVFSETFPILTDGNLIGAVATAILPIIGPYHQGLLSGSSPSMSDQTLNSKIDAALDKIPVHRDENLK